MRSITWLNWLERRLAQARALSFADWLTLAEAWLALGFFAVLLRLVSARRLEIPSRGTDALPGSALDADRARRLHRLVGLAARLHWPVKTCLPRALALRWMLSRRRIGAFLRIGVSKPEGQLQAHAWVEVGGQAVGEAPDLLQRFQPLGEVNGLTF